MVGCQSGLLFTAGIVKAISWSSMAMPLMADNAIAVK